VDVGTNGWGVRVSCRADRWSGLAEIVMWWANQLASCLLDIDYATDYIMMN